MSDTDRRSGRRADVSVADGVAFIVGIVVGIGIFKSPQGVAQNVANESVFVAIWIVGGLITLIGALVYAELGSAFPSAGGEYHFLSRALGQPVALLFAWARVSVLQTGIIAAVAFVFGDYAQKLVPLGPGGPAIHAALALVVLTLINLSGTRHGRGVQLVLTGMSVTAIIAVVIAGLSLSHPHGVPVPRAGGSSLGVALVFVLFTYGGWSEAAYLSGDMRASRRNIMRALVIATGIITVIYILMNLAYLNVLGLDGIRKSSAVGADVVRAVAGVHGEAALAFVICCAALGALNGSIFTGARLYQAVSNDLPALQRLGLRSVPDARSGFAFLAQAVVAMALIALGALTRDGFLAMVYYTAPVFWLFLLLVGVSFFVLRSHKPEVDRPFRAPLYPVTPALHCLTCAFLLYSSLVETRLGALIGLAVLLMGVPVVWLAMRKQQA